MDIEWNTVIKTINKLLNSSMLYFGKIWWFLKYPSVFITRQFSARYRLCFSLFLIFLDSPSFSIGNSSHEYHYVHSTDSLISKTRCEWCNSIPPVTYWSLTWEDNRLTNLIPVLPLHLLLHQLSSVFRPRTNDKRSHRKSLPGCLDAEEINI